MYETFISWLHSFVTFLMYADVNSTWMISMTLCIVLHRLWCAMSSPLTLSLDFTNKTAVEYVHRPILAMYRYAISITSSASYL